MGTNKCGPFDVGLIDLDEIKKLKKGGRYGDVETSRASSMERTRGTMKEEERKANIENGLQLCKDENKVFVVTSGKYSDYRIERVFSTRKKALEYLDTKDDGYTLEVFDLDEPIERKTQIYEICFELDKKKVLEVNTTWDVRYKDTIHIGSRYFNNLKTLDIYVESDSRKRALKIASERYGAIIAGEQTMYPYLRVGMIIRYSSMCPAFFDFKTGEIVLFDREELAVELPDFIKVRRAEPLKE